MAQFTRLLGRWNRKINLTAINDEAQVITHHLLDSLSVLPYIRGRRVLDMGSGGGLPGIPLAIVREELRFTLLDARNKKVQFLNHVRAELGLENIVPLHRRAEDIHPDPLFNTVVARAFAPLDKIYRLANPLCAQGGVILAMKGRCPQQELAQLQRTGVRYKVKSLEVAGLDARRHLVLMETRPPAAA